MVLSLHIDPLEMTIISFGGEETDALVSFPEQRDAKTLTGFTVSRAESKAYPNFTDPEPIDALTNMARKYPDFSGYYRYETGHMLVTLEISVAIVQLLQGLGNLAARKIDHRK